MSGRVQGDRMRGTDTDARRVGSWARGEGRNMKGPRGAAYRDAEFGRPKSRMGLPERFVIGCMDGLADPDGVGWIYRQLMPWEKPNGMPESVKDRTRDNFEHWFHLTKNGDYYSAVDELRDPHATSDAGSEKSPKSAAEHGDGGFAHNTLGRLPGSVWNIATEPLSTPDYFIARTADAMTGQWITGDANAWRWAEHAGVLSSPWPRPSDDTEGPFLFVAPEHFAAFPSEWPRRLILGFSPPGICTACGEGRRPVVDREFTGTYNDGEAALQRRRNATTGGADRVTLGRTDEVNRAITGYVCACTPSRKVERDGDWRDGRVESSDHRNAFGAGSGNAVPRRPGGFGTKVPLADARIEYDLTAPLPPTRPAVILDPFGGTGTTAMVARALGRFGISLDLSADYCRLAGWRIFESGGGAKSVARTYQDRQGALL